MAFPSSRHGSVDGHMPTSPLAMPRLSLDMEGLRISSPKTMRAQTGTKSPFGMGKNAGGLEPMSLDSMPTTGAIDSTSVIDVRGDGANDSNWSLSGARSDKAQQAASKEPKSPRILRAVLSRSKEAFRQIVSSSTKGYTFKDFAEVQQVGTGACSDVYVAKHRPSGQVVAVKEMGKRAAAETGRVRSVFLEKEVLKTLTVHDCPFIARMFGSFTDDDNVYFVMQFCPGGELYSYIQANPRFRPDQARFYVCEILLALQHMHVMEHIIYRDLKPENVLLDGDGHVRLIDFGNAKRLPEARGHRTYTVCGTLDYLAPEIIWTASAAESNQQGPGYTFSADYWSLGCLLYEMLAGQLPFQGETPLQKCEAIASGRFAIPEGTDPITADLLVRLLQVDPAQRLGARGIAEIMGHPWFAQVDWVAVKHKMVKPPHKPDLEGSSDTAYFKLQLQKEDLALFAFMDE